jgi:hypothetical protein
MFAAAVAPPLAMGISGRKKNKKPAIGWITGFFEFHLVRW